MRDKRREFLKGTAIAGAAATVAACGHLEHMHPAPTAQAAKLQPGGAMPRNMTFVTLADNDGYRLGVRTNRGILDVRHAAIHHARNVPTTIDDLVRYGDNGLSDLVRTAETNGPAPLFLDETKVKYGPSVTNPGKIVCVGLNYARHARETNNPIPKLPILFNKYNNTLNCHNGTVRVSDVPATNFDYESELVVVMGRRAHNVSEADALAYVFGYCNGNDFTARDLQGRSSQWMIGKTNDGFGLLGPWLVTADQCNPNDMKIVGTVNGEVRQSSNTADMVFNCRQLISYISKHFTLRPGDIIFTGTPEGVIAGFPKDKQVWLKPGDKVVTNIEKLGELSFTLT